MKAKLIVATVQNNAGINHSIKQVAGNALKQGIPEEGLLNRVEMVVRAYDPCLTCAAHVAGRIPLEITIEDKNGSKRVLTRNSSK